MARPLSGQSCGEILDPLRATKTGPLGVSDKALPNPVRFQGLGDAGAKREVEPHPRITLVACKVPPAS